MSPRTTRRPALRATIAADIAAMARLKGRTEVGPGAVIDVLMLPGTWATLLFRS
jgi:hypothetical protein